VGLWSLAVRMTDGASKWTRSNSALFAKEKAGPNIYQVFPAKGSVLYAAAEQGPVSVPAMGGATWTLIKKGNAASYGPGSRCRTVQSWLPD